MPADVLVIGGGIIGTLTAICLAEKGAGVRVVDGEMNAGTLTNAGSLHVQLQSRFMRLYPQFVPALEAALPLYAAAAEAWIRLDQRLGPFELVREGGLMVAEDEEQLDFLEDKANRETRMGLSVDILDRHALERLAPWLASRIIGAEICFNEGKVNPLVANRRLRSHADRLGIDFVHDRIDRVTEEGGRAVATNRAGGRHTADQVVVAASWDTGRIVRGLGVTIPTAPEPLHMNVTEAAAPQIRHLVQHADRPITLKQLHSGQIVIGGGWPAEGRGPDTPPGIVAGSMLGNVALAAKMVPSVGKLRLLRSWTGVNTTIDGASVIGHLPNARRLIVAVPGDAGYTLAPLVAGMAASIALGETPPEDPRPFSPARFAG